MELKEILLEIIKEMEEPDICIRYNECSIDIVTPYKYVHVDVIKELNKILGKYNYELIGIEARKDKLSFTIIKKKSKGTDDGIVADPETSVKDVCRPETGK